MKKTIEEAAEDYMNSCQPKMSWFRDDFIVGAKSEEAKEFHTQGMYSEEDVKNIACTFFNHHLWNETFTREHVTVCFDNWFKDYKKRIYEST